MESRAKDFGSAVVLDLEGSRVPELFDGSLQPFYDLVSFSIGF